MINAASARNMTKNHIEKTSENILKTFKQIEEAIEDCKFSIMVTIQEDYTDEEIFFLKELGYEVLFHFHGVNYTEYLISWK